MRSAQSQARFTGTTRHSWTQGPHVYVLLGLTPKHGEDLACFGCCTLARWVSAASSPCVCRWDCGQDAIPARGNRAEGLYVDSATGSVDLCGCVKGQGDRKTSECVSVSKTCTVRERSDVPSHTELVCLRVGAPPRDPASWRLEPALQNRLPEGLTWLWRPCRRTKIQLCGTHEMHYEREVVD